MVLPTLPETLSCLLVTFYGALRVEFTWKGLFGDDLKVIQTTSDFSEFTPPRRLEPRRPKNPFSIKERVVVRALIDENGNVLKAVIIEGENSEPNMLTLQWMKQWKFKPMKYKGVAVRTIVSQRFNPSK